MPGPQSRTSHTLPRGTVTFLLTDVVGSTELWETDPEAMSRSIHRHEEIIQETAESLGGAMPWAQGEGDSALLVFDTAKAGVECAIEIQKALVDEKWDGPPISVRSGLHAGEAEVRDATYFGSSVNRAARIRSLASAGQILLSQAVFDLIRDRLPDGASVTYLGTHSLKGLSRPEHVYQLTHEGLSKDFPPLHSIETTPNNLPLQLTNFVGRVQEIAEVSAALGRSRLVTLSGAGGFGKTRLSLEVAARVLGQFTDGVWLVELAALRDPSWVTGQVARAVGVEESLGREGGPDDVETLLANHLGSKTTLIILDNCEHLIPPCARLVNHLMASTANTRVMVTSREPLGIPGETIYSVPPLSLPGEGEISVSDAMSFDAVRLFADRAAARDARWSVKDDQVADLLAIVRRVEGMPLAIELAASLVDVLNLPSLAKRLDEQFRILSSDRGFIPRHQTIRAVVEWSYDLLSDDERRLFEALSVFVGGFSLEAAEGVCGAVVGTEVLSVLTKLIHKSLVFREEREGENRFGMHETIRQFARGLFSDREEALTIRRRHRDWFLEFAEEANPKLRGVQQPAWLEILDLELDNFRAAFQWSLATEDIEAAVRLAVALRLFFSVRGHLAEGRSWLESAISGCGNSTSALRVKALAGAGLVARSQGDFAAANRYLSEALVHARDFDQATELPAILANLGYLARYKGDYKEAVELFGEALEGARKIGDANSEAIALANLGVIDKELADYDQARKRLSEAVDIARGLGDKWVLGFGLFSLGRVNLAEGDLAAAGLNFKRAHEVAREIGDRRGMAWNLGGLAKVAWESRDYRAAETYAREASATAREIVDRRAVASAVGTLALVALSDGSADFGPLIEESMKLAESTNDRPLVAELLLDVACVISKDRPELSARLLGASEAAMSEMGSLPSLLEESRKAEMIADANNLLGPDTFEEHRRAGRELLAEDFMSEVATLIAKKGR